MTSGRRRDAEHELQQFVAAGVEVIRARDADLARVLDCEPPGPSRTWQPVAGPIFTHPVAQRIKLMALKIKPLRPLLRRARSLVVRWRA